MITKVGMNVALIDGDTKKVEKKGENIKEEQNLSAHLKATEGEQNVKMQEEIKPVVNNYRALWVIDEKNNVLIRIEDEKGNLIRQIPPEEIVNLKEKINELIKNYFKVEV